MFLLSTALIHICSGVDGCQCIGFVNMNDYGEMFTKMTNVAETRRPSNFLRKSQDESHHGAIDERQEWETDIHETASMIHVEP